ncbi:DUF4817 domain-containing protein [Trichonephila clavipes]|nr:DUF4817 domain-containing protein [Trichonephila clavipes]
MCSAIIAVLCNIFFLNLLQIQSKHKTLDKSPDLQCYHCAELNVREEEMSKIIHLELAYKLRPFKGYDPKELWFQQDGATCHTGCATIDLLKDTFNDRLISRFGPVNWPPRSCDLTPLYHFLWGYVKSLVYADKPQTLDHLEDNIRRVIADKRPYMLEKVIENWTSRLDYIRASRGSRMKEIIKNVMP